MSDLVIPSITVICYLIAELFKVIIFKDENKYKYVPIIVGFVGGGLGVILNLLTPFTDIFTSIMIGIISGLASTGANQIIKQFKKGYGEKDD